MKKSNLFLVAIAMALVFVSCKSEDEIKTTFVDFEDVTLNNQGISNAPSFLSDNFSFSINNGEFWNGGIVCSSKNDTLTTGPQNQYSSIVGFGAFKSTHFGVVYSPGSFTCPNNPDGAYSIKSIMLTNSTYAYWDLINGSDYSKKFSQDDWFKVIIQGFNKKAQTSSVDYYLADFRNGKTEISRSWNKVDLSKLGQVDSVAFTFDSSDKGQWGVNTPAYVCIDNIEFTQTIASK